jgi:hypothetical protein
MSEVVNAASSCVSEENIRKWFDEVQEYIRENNLEEVMDDPSRLKGATQKYVLRRVVLKEYCALHLAADTVTT